MQAIKNFVAVTLGVTCSLVVAASLLTRQSASALEKPTQTQALRAFYLTTTEHTGDQPLTACAAGFHMASLWEIFDPSNLRYDTTLGYTAADSGSGPPAGVFGWIRTGFAGSASADPGSANCNVWNPTELFHGGSAASLNNHWDFTPEAVSPWRPFAFGCSASLRVWCVEN